MTKRHTWTPEHDAALRQAVEDCRPLFELYTSGHNKRYGKYDAWDAVAGRLLPDVVVTGGACAARWDHHERQRADAEAEVLAAASGQPEDLARDRWTEVAEMVAEYEASVAERTEEALARIEKQVLAIARVVDALARELGITETWE